MKYKFFNISFFIIILIAFSCRQHHDYFQIEVLDSVTKRGIPIAKISNINGITYYSDSYGNIAYNEQEVMGRDLYFLVEAEGYKIPKDDTGRQSVILTPNKGEKAIIFMQRIQPAERLYRVTGTGIYRDTELLGLRVPPLATHWDRGQVLGQDSNLGTIYKNRIFFIWGDTFLPTSYHGNFSVAGGTIPLPSESGIDPDVGFEIDYFVDQNNHTKKMIHLVGPGYIWFDWIMVVKDQKNQEVLAAKYARVNALFGNYERGIAVFNEQKEEFEKRTEISEWLKAPHLTQHPFLTMSDNVSYFYLASQFNFSRVKPLLTHIEDPDQYEYFTCLAPGSRWAERKLERKNGQLVYGWKQNTEAIDEQKQKILIEEGLIRPEEGWLQLMDVATGQPITSYRGSVFWNEFRQKWILISGAQAIWYSEADTPLGPWHYAVKVADHHNYFYNPHQHPYLDKGNGRFIYFEGTYTKFIGPEPQVPRYDYNQVMYRLDLSDDRLRLPAPIYELEGALKMGHELLTEDWKSISRVAFYALAPEQATGDQVRVYDPKSGQAVFAGETLYESLISAYVGSWEVQIDYTSFENFFQVGIVSDHGEIEVKPKNPKFEISEERLVGDSIYFFLRHEGMKFHLQGKVIAGQIMGSWRQEGFDLGGKWSGDRLNNHDWWPKYNGRLIKLYEISNAKNGAKMYQTEADEVPLGWERSKVPICLVWKNPFKYLIADPEARPIATINSVF